MTPKLYALSTLAIAALFLGCAKHSSPGTPTRHASSAEATVISIVSKQLDLIPEKVKPSSHIISELGADELDFVELIMTIEETFQIEITDEAIEQKFGTQPTDYLKVDLTVRQLAELACGK